MSGAAAILSKAYDDVLISELLAAYEEAKRNFYLGGHRLSAVEGGRFCEAAFRVLEEVAFKNFTPIGVSLDTDGVIRRLERLPATGGLPKSVRIYLPRALRVVYDIRNSRDAAHLADGIDPNLQDATLVVSILDWVLAEFIRISGAASADESQAMVEAVVTRKVPIIQEFGSFPKVLKSGLRAGEHVLVLLYSAGSKGVARAELGLWVNPSRRKNLGRTLRSLVDKALVHDDGAHVFITYAGQKTVEAGGLLDPT